jgi:hypothetical protein
MAVGPEMHWRHCEFVVAFGGAISGYFLVVESLELTAIF